MSTKFFWSDWCGEQRQKKYIWQILQIDRVTFLQELKYLNVHTFARVKRQA